MGEVWGDVVGMAVVASASRARAVGERDWKVAIAQCMCIGLTEDGSLEGDVSRSLPFPLISGSLLGGAEWRRRDLDRGVEGGRGAPDEIRRMEHEL